MIYLLIHFSFSAKTKTGSFTPFSQTLGSMIREIHNGLSAALDTESNTSALNQILKVCFVYFLNEKSTSALIANAPYERLSPGLLTGIVSRLNNFALSEGFFTSVNY